MVCLSDRMHCAQQTHTYKKTCPAFRPAEVRSDGDCIQRLVARTISKLPDLPLQPNSIPDMAESFTKVTLDTVADESRKKTADGVARSPSRLCSRDGKGCCYGDVLSTIFMLVFVSCFLLFVFLFFLFFFLCCIPVCLSSSCPFVCAAAVCYSQQVRIL